MCGHARVLLALILMRIDKFSFLKLLLSIQCLPLSAFLELSPERTVAPWNVGWGFIMVPSRSARGDGIPKGVAPDAMWRTRLRTAFHPLHGSHYGNKEECHLFAIRTADKQTAGLKLAHSISELWPASRFA